MTNGDWHQTTLGSLSSQRGKSIEPGKTPTQKFELYSVPSFPNGKPEVVEGKNIGSNKQTVSPRSVLLCKINPRINRAWVVGDFTTYPKIASTEWIVFPETETVVPNFLCYFLQQNSVRDFLASNVSGVGGSLMRVKASTLRDFPFAFPDHEEQRRIVAEIEKQFTRLDSGAASLKRVQIALKRYRASVLKSACEGGLVPTEAELARRQNRSYETGEQLLQRMLKQRREKWNGKGKYKEPRAPEPPPDRPLPDGWFWTGFEQLSDGSKNAIKAGPFGSSLKKSFYTPSGFKIYGQEQVINGDPYFGDYFVSRELFEQLQSCEVRPGDILISLVGTAGKVLILPDDCAPGIINPRLLKLSLNRSDLNAKFIKILLESATARAFFKLAAHGGTMEILNLGILKSLPIPLPPIVEQHRIVSEVERRLSVIEDLEAAVVTNLQRAARLRAAVLQRTFPGTLAQPLD
jgi:type I restriction enzyme S subunit